MMHWSSSTKYSYDSLHLGFGQPLPYLNLHLDLLLLGVLLGRSSSLVRLLWSSESSMFYFLHWNSCLPICLVERERERERCHYLDSTWACLVWRDLSLAPPSLYIIVFLVLLAFIFPGWPGWAGWGYLVCSFNATSVLQMNQGF